MRVAREQPDPSHLIDAIIEEREKNPKLAKNMNVVITIVVLQAFVSFPASSAAINPKNF